MFISPEPESPDVDVPVDVESDFPVPPAFAPPPPEAPPLLAPIMLPIGIPPPESDGEREPPSELSWNPPKLGLPKFGEEDTWVDVDVDVAALKPTEFMGC